VTVVDIPMVTLTITVQSNVWVYMVNAFQFALASCSWPWPHHGRKPKPQPRRSTSLSPFLRKLTASSWRSKHRHTKQYPFIPSPTARLYSPTTGGKTRHVERSGSSTTKRGGGKAYPTLSEWAARTAASRQPKTKSSPTISITPVRSRRSR
jgi:hypothetical protein